MTTRDITYPADALERIASRLQDIDWNLPRDEAENYALDIVLEVTAAVDTLRQAERGNAVDVRLSRPTAVGLLAMIREMNQAKVLPPDSPQALETSAWLEEIAAAVRAAFPRKDNDG